VVFLWSSTMHQAFEAVQQALSTTPVLALPDFNKLFILETDASNLGIGAVLLQDIHPIAYLSESLNKTNQERSTYEKECLAILLAVDKWCSFFSIGNLSFAWISAVSSIWGNRDSPILFSTKPLLSLWDCNTKFSRRHAVPMWQLMLFLTVKQRWWGQFHHVLLLGRKI
jgi:hypothetical protein